MSKTEILELLKDKEIRAEIVGILRDVTPETVTITQVLDRGSARDLYIKLENDHCREATFGKI